MKRIFALVLAAALLCLPACSGGKNGATSSDAVKDYPVSAFDVTLKACPQKIVSLSPAVTEILLELGNEAQLVGVSKGCNAAQGVPRLGSADAPDIDAALALEPDLVFTSALISQKDKAKLASKGAVVVPVAGVSHYNELPALYNDIARLVSGDITGARNASNTFNRVDEVLKALKKPAEPVKVALFYSSDQPVPKGGIVDELLAFAGAVNVVTDADMTDDEIVAAGAEWILCADADLFPMLSRFSSPSVCAFETTALETFDMGMAKSLEGLNKTIVQ